MPENIRQVFNEANSFSMLGEDKIYQMVEMRPIDFLFQILTKFLNKKFNDQIPDMLMD